MTPLRTGFDAAIRERAADTLGRWPFAREIFALATRLPEEWSVRIGVYGDWGTGKTSVLNFVEAMAKEARHAVFYRAE